MLTTSEEDRFEEAMPASADVAYDATTTSYTLTPFWGGANDLEDPDYPMLVFQWQNQNTPESQRQPVNDIHDIRDDPDSTDLIEERVSEVSDSLSLTVAVEADWDGSTPPGVRARQISRQVWRHIEFEIDLNSEGANGERPMRIESREQTNFSPVRVEDTYRVEFVIQFHHRETSIKKIPTVEEFDSQADVE